VDSNGENIIDVYIDPSFSTAANIGGLNTQQARRLIQQSIQRFNADSGVYFRINWTNIIRNDLTCDGNPGGTQFDDPFILILGDLDLAYCGGNGAACARWEKRNDGSENMNCGAIYFSEMGQAGRPYFHYTAGLQLQNIAIHELMHTLTYAHPDNLFCAGTDVSTFDETVTCGCVAGGNNNTFRYLTKADVIYLRNNYGFYGRDLRAQNYSGGNYTYATNKLYSPVRGTDNIDEYDISGGYVYNTEFGNRREVRAFFYENNSWTSEEVPSNYESYSVPDITRATNLTLDKWIIASLYGDNITDADKGILLAERAYGGSVWDLSATAPLTIKNSLSIAYDTISHHIIIGYLDNADEISLITRDIDGSSMTTSTIHVQSFDGVDIACSKYYDFDGSNCTIVYISDALNSSMRMIRFGVTSNGTLQYPNDNPTPIFVPFVANSKPAISASKINSNPKFFLSFEQGNDIIYNRTLDANSNIWSGQPPIYPDDDWLISIGSGVWDTSNHEIIYGAN